MLVTVLLLVLGFAFLIKGADFLIDGASALAKRFRIPDLVIGMTIVAFGTSLPELFVNVIASVDGNTDLAIGNILGSNIANILLILGIASIIAPLAVRQNTIWKEIPFSTLAVVAIAILANDVFLDGAALNVLAHSDGLTLLCFFSVFLYYIASVTKQDSSESESTGEPQYGVWHSIAFIAAGLVGLSLGGKWIVDGAVQISTSLGIGQRVIGLSVVAIGTSLPELAASAVAAYKNNADIAIGNVVGSNIFNIFWILGISSTIAPLPLHPSANIDIAVTLVASALLFFLVFVSRPHRLCRRHGITFLLLYTAYMSYTLAMA